MFWEWFRKHICWVIFTKGNQSLQAYLNKLTQLQQTMDVDRSTINIRPTWRQSSSRQTNQAQSTNYSMTYKKSSSMRKLN
eukprot:Pgem_evm1s18657